MSDEKKEINLYDSPELDNEDIGILSRRQSYLVMKKMLDESDVPEPEWEDYIKSYEEYWDIRLNLANEYLTQELTLSKIAVLEAKLKRIGGN